MLPRALIISPEDRFSCISLSFSSEMNALRPKVLTSDAISMVMSWRPLLIGMDSMLKTSPSITGFSLLPT